MEDIKVGGNNASDCANATHASLPSVEAVFSGTDDRGATSTPVPLCPPRLFPKSAHEEANGDPPRTPAVRSQDIPIVLKKLVKMFELSGERSTADSGYSALPDPDTCAMVFDVDALRATFAAARAAYPANWLHCMAIKCCPLSFVIQELLGAGLGVEAASFVELYLGLAHGCPPGLAVFDSPAKTDEELAMALTSGVFINVNSLDELDRIELILQKQTRTNVHDQSPVVDARVGIRLNPHVGYGTISELSTAVQSGKFGVPVTPQNLTAVVNAFRKWPWVVGLHTHVGSQGCSLEQLTRGAAVMCDVADMVDSELGKGRVAVLDIGGGLPANYESDEVGPTFREHAAVLRKAAPQLFENTGRQVITEFGRAMVAKAAFTVSKVEYVRDNAISGHSQSDEALSVRAESDATARQSDLHESQPKDSPPPSIHQTLVIHVGADMFVRTAYRPSSFQHRFSLFGKEGEVLTGPICRTEVAGPLCFQGDYVTKGTQLPRASSGDLIVVHDTGANTIALFSRHCSRPAPPVYGYARDANGELCVEVIKKKESIRDIARFWGASV